VPAKQHALPFGFSAIAERVVERVPFGSVASMRVHVCPKSVVFARNGSRLSTR